MTVQKLITTRASKKLLYLSLGLPESATPEEIREAWRQIARTYHPDQNAGTECGIFTNARHAYGVLSDPVKRSVYDASGLDPDETSNATQIQALAVIRQTALHVIAAGMIDGNILARIRDSIAKDKSSAESEARTIDSAVAGARKAAANIRNRWRGAEAARDSILQMIDEQIHADMQAKAVPLRTIELASTALAFLASAEYELPSMNAPDFDSIMASIMNLPIASANSSV